MNQVLLLPILATCFFDGPVEDNHGFATISQKVPGRCHYVPTGPLNVLWVGNVEFHVDGDKWVIAVINTSAETR